MAHLYRTPQTIEEARQRYEAAVKTAAEAQIEARAMKRCITEMEERTRQERRANKHAMQASSFRFAVTLISVERDVAQAIERLIETAKDMENGR